MGEGEVARPRLSVYLEWLTWAYVPPWGSSSCVFCCGQTVRGSLSAWCHSTASDNFPHYCWSDAFKLSGRLGHFPGGLSRGCLSLGACDAFYGSDSTPDTVSCSFGSSHMAHVPDKACCCLRTFALATPFSWFIFLGHTLHSRTLPTSLPTVHHPQGELMEDGSDLLTAVPTALGGRGKCGLPVPICWVNE